MPREVTSAPPSCTTFPATLAVVFVIPMAEDVETVGTPIFSV